MEHIKLALLQMDLAWENPEENRNRAEYRIDQLPVDVDVVILPEMFTTGFHMAPEGLAEAPGGPTLQWMQKMADRIKGLVMGSVIVKEDGKYFNRMYAVTFDGQVVTYDKRHLFRMAGEDKSYHPGQDLPIIEFAGWRICPLICYDLRFPVWSRNTYTDGKPAYDLLIYVANWPERRSAHWKLLLQARAVENQAFVAGVNRVGTDGNDILYSGDSAVIDPLGRHIAQGAWEENVLFAELDPAVIQNYREQFPAWKDADRFEIQ